MGLCSDDILGRETPKQAAETAFEEAFRLAAVAIADDIVRRALTQKLTFSFHADRKTFATGQTEDAAWHTWLLEKGADAPKAYEVMQSAVNQANSAYFKIYSDGTMVSYPSNRSVNYTFTPKPPEPPQ